MNEKHWPVRVTSKIAADAMDMCKLDRSKTIALNCELLREHQKYMIPFSKRWARAEKTIKNLEAQIEQSSGGVASQPRRTVNL